MDHLDAKTANCACAAAAISYIDRVEGIMVWKGMYRARSLVFLVRDRSSDGAYA